MLTRRLSSGGPFAIEYVHVSDLGAGELKTSWTLEAAHSSVAEQGSEAMAAALKQVAVGMLLSSTMGAWDVSDEMNRMFPKFEFQDAEQFLTLAWKSGM